MLITFCELKVKRKWMRWRLSNNEIDLLANLNASKMKCSLQVNLFFSVIETPLEFGWSMLCEKWCWLLSNSLHGTQIYTKAICRERCFEFVANVKSNWNYSEKNKNDFQNSHISKWVFSSRFVVVYQTHKTYFYHHLSRQLLCWCSTISDHITLYSFLFVISLVNCAHPSRVFINFSNGNERWESKGIRCLTRFHAAPNHFTHKYTGTHIHNSFRESIFLFYFQEHHLISPYENNKNNK